MKIITFWGGLGNQIFEYAYFLWLKKKFPNEKYYSYCPSIGLSAHNGLEIDKIFSVSLPPQSCLSNIIGSVLFFLFRICNKLHFATIATCTHSNMRYDSIFHCDYWQDKKYILDGFRLNFPLHTIDDVNRSLAKTICECNSVAVHIRRGDYMSPENLSLYGDICNLEYYQDGINYIMRFVDNPFFFFFSEDSHYVKENFHINNMIVVDWNKGSNSYLDMFLMSQCKNMILANSTFSYWAARFNQNSNIIVCPNRWTNINPPDIILNSWIIL